MILPLFLPQEAKPGPTQVQRRVARVFGVAYLHASTAEFSLGCLEVDIYYFALVFLCAESHSPIARMTIG